MQNLQPEQGTLLLQLALPVLKNEHKTTRRVIEAIPLDKGDYRPEPLAKNRAGDCLAHCRSGAAILCGSGRRHV